MTTLVITDTDPRSVKALQIAMTAHRWLRDCQLNDGRRATGIPSQRNPLAYHWTDGRTCSCYDDRHSVHGPCKHVRAYRLDALARGKAQPASDVIDGLAEMVAERQGPVLDMIREEDGSVRWERLHQHPAPDSETVRLAAQYDRIFGRFTDQTDEQIMGRL